MLHFDKQNHTYTIGGKKFKYSVTGLVSEFCPEFPKELVAQATAKRDGTNAEDIIAEWDLNGSLSNTYGNAIHKAIEYWIKYQKVPKHPYLAYVVERWKETNNIKGQIRAEMAVYSEELGVCGTMDILEITGEKRAKIHDIKTNADLHKDGSKMKDPFTDLKATPLNKYRLQLSIYKDLMERLGWTIEGIYLWHWLESWERIELKTLNVENIWTKIS